MKHLQLIILFLALTASQVFSQDRLLFQDYKSKANRSFFGGPVFGLNATQIDGDGYGGYNKTGIYAGVALNIFIQEQWSLDFQMLYSRKGSIDRGTINDPYSGPQFADYIAKVNVIEMPIHISYYHFPKFVLFGGASLNALISEYEEFPIWGTTDQDNDPNFEMFSVDLSLGVRYNLIENLYAQAKFSYGITPMRKVSNTPFIVNYGSHQINNQLSFGFQYLF